MRDLKEFQEAETVTISLERYTQLQKNTEASEGVIYDAGSYDNKNCIIVRTDNLQKMAGHVVDRPLDVRRGQRIELRQTAVGPVEQILVDGVLVFEKRLLDQYEAAIQEVANLERIAYSKNNAELRGMFLGAKMMLLALYPDSDHPAIKRWREEK